MRALALLALLGLGGGPADDAEAERALAELRHGFATRSRAEAEQKLAELGARFPASPAAGRALLWLGDLELGDGAADRADARYAEVQRRFPSGELSVLAERGRGACAYAHHDWTAAAARFARALTLGPDAALAAELSSRHELALRERARYRAELLAWAVLAVALVAFAAPLRRGARVPLATWFLLPVQALLLAAAWGRDAALWPALAGIALGSTVLTTLALAPTQPRGRGRLALDAALVAAATVALGYIALRRAGVLDALWQTLQIGGAL